MMDNERMYHCMGSIQALKEDLNYHLAPLLETPVPIPKAQVILVPQ